MSDQGLRVYALGGFRVERGADVVPIDQGASRAGRQLFKWLLTRRTRRLPREEAFDLLWPNSEPESTSTLRVAIFRLRRVLEPGVTARDSILDFDADTISIRRDADIWVDADAFERLVAEAGRADEPAELLEEADRLYAGEYLPDDLYDDWATQRRESLSNLWTELQFNLSRSREQRGDVPGAILALQRLLEKDRCDERAARELMLMLARHGRRSEALRVYHRLVDVLREELGAEPSAETSEVQRQVTSSVGVPGVVAPSGNGPGGDTAMVDARIAQARPGWPDRGEALGRGESQATMSGRRPGTPAAPPRPFEPTYPFPMPELLVGRHDDMANAQRTLERGLNEGQIILIGAPAGTGKSSLAGMLLHRARALGFLCLAGGSFDHDSPTLYGPIRDALGDYLLAQSPHDLRAELGDLAVDLQPIIPELRYHLGDARPAGGRPPEPGQLLAAVHGYLRILTASQPVLLCLDDLHASDGATVEMLHYLTRQTRRLRIVFVMTYRSDEVFTNRPLSRMLSALNRDRLAHEIRLRALDRDETRVLIASLLDGQVSDDLIDSLYAVTEGNPLFVEQFVLALHEERRIVQRDGVWLPSATEDTPVPPLVQSVIERRFERLPPNGRETLAMASVLGQAFELRPLVAALGSEDEAAAIAVLDGAIDAQLVYETTNGYRFGHAMIRESLYRSSSGPHRALLHARAGTAIEALAGVRADERAAELAHHFALAAAAAPTAEKAVRFALTAGRRAAELSAHREALAHFTRACELIEQNRDLASLDTRLDALDGRGQAERNLSEWRACIASYRRILELSGSPSRRARAHDAIGRALLQVGDQSAAIAEFEVGLSELQNAPVGSEVEAARVQLMFDQAFPILLQGRPSVALELGSQMLPVASRLGQPRLLYNAHSVIAIAHMRQGRAEEAEAQYALARAAAEQLDDKLPLALVLVNLGAHHYLIGEFDTARAHLARARGLLDDTAAERRWVLAFRILALIELAEGDLTGALAQAELAYRNAIENGDRYVGECYEVLGAVHAARADWDMAASYFERALGIYQGTENIRGIPDALIGLGSVHERQADWPAAAERYRQALDVTSRMDHSPHAIAVHRHLGRLLLHQGDATAREHLERAHTLAQSMPRSLEHPPTLLAVAELTSSDDPARALALAERSLGPAASPEHTVEARLFLATLCAATGRQREAQTHAAACSGVAERIGSFRALGFARLALGRAAMLDPSASAHFEAAIRYFDRARTPYERGLAQADHARVSAQ